MKNNGNSYADRKRIKLKIERNNSMTAQNNQKKKEFHNDTKINQKVKVKRLASYKEPPNSSKKEKEKSKENIKLYKKINIDNESLRNKTIKPIKNISNIPTLKYIDINLNNNRKKIFNIKSSIEDYDDFLKKEKLIKKRNVNNETQINDKNSTKNKKKKMNNSYCSSKKDISKLINNSNNNAISIASKSSRKGDDILLIQDEILELKLMNSRCNNEIIILKEKNNSLIEIVDMKDKEIQLIKNKYMQMIEDSNNEQIKLKQKLENDFKKKKKKYDISIKSIKSLIETVIELTETLIFSEKSSFGNGYKNINNNFNQVSSSGVGDCSLDIFESNTNIDNNKDEDNKRNFILEQIKEIIIEKINNIIYKLNLGLDNSLLDKIERLTSWNFNNFNMKYFPNYSLNFNNFVKRNNTNANNTANINDELFSGSLSKYNMSLNNEVSNDFDFSVSKSFYNPSSNISASPKFNKSIKVEKNHINTNGNKNSKRLLFSFDEVSKINQIKNNNKLNNSGNNNLNLNNHNIFNILEYSMVDLINSREYASSNIHSIININNTVNNNNYTESKDNNFKGFYESFLILKLNIFKRYNKNRK